MTKKLACLDTFGTIDYRKQYNDAYVTTEDRIIYYKCIWHGAISCFQAEYYKCFDTYSEMEGNYFTQL